MLEQLRSELQVKACALRDREAATRSEITDRDETIAQLRQSLRRKDTLLQVARFFHAVVKTLTGLLFILLKLLLCFSFRSIQSC